MKTISISRFITTCCCALFVSAASADTFTFENGIPSGVDGLQWSGFNLVNGNSMPQSGYHNGIVSGNNVASDIDGRVASISSKFAFTFNSAYFTAAWNDGLQLEIKGYVGGYASNGVAPAFDKVFTLNTSGPTRIDFPLVGVDELDFIPSGGALHSGYTDHGINDTIFAVDNLTISLPENSDSYILLGAAFGGLAVARKRLIQK